MKPAGPVIGVLALQGDVPEHLRAFESAGARAVPVRRPEELDRLDGLVIPGGESTTLWRLSVAFDVLEPLRKLIDEGLPAFGSCAGMIMLADRLADGVAGQLTYGGIDIMVCNAAVNPVFGPLAQLTDEAFDKIMSANVKATIWFANLACPGMAARGGGAAWPVGRV